MKKEMPRPVNPDAPPEPCSIVVKDTVAWLERAVIGLNLCPFAKSVHTKGLVHYAVSTARGVQQLLVELEDELNALMRADPSSRDTTLLIVPDGLQDFWEFNDFLTLADRTLEDLQLAGVIQIASFHPNYQFAGAPPQDITNFTNRSPYPTLHLLREESIDRAVVAFPQAEAIFEKNMQTLTDLGASGWLSLGLEAHYSPAQSKPDPTRLLPDVADPTSR